MMWLMVIGYCRQQRVPFVKTAFVVILAAFVSGCLIRRHAVPTFAADPAIIQSLDTARERHQVPAIAAAIVTTNGLIRAGVAGVRKKGSSVAATANDLWHLGSATKAMTATLVAKLVEQGKLDWNTTLAEVFPNLSNTFDPEVRTITALQLLCHRSGLPPNPNLMIYRGEDGRHERRRILENELSKPLLTKPGTQSAYSNLGYIVIGAMIEEITGKSWEQAIRDELFEPLKMSTAGFGGTGTPGVIDQPWPHTADGSPVQANGSAVDNPPVMGPAGRVHCTLQDWARFIHDQLLGSRGEPALLRPESYRRLHRPPFGDSYAPGWMAFQREWGGGGVLHHAGDNTMNFANVWVAPNRAFAVLVCVNQSGERAFQASDEVIRALIAAMEN